MTTREAVVSLAPWLNHHHECARHEAELCDCGLNAALVEAKESLPTIPLTPDAAEHVEAMVKALQAFYNGSHGYHGDMVNR